MVRRTTGRRRRRAGGWALALLVIGVLVALIAAVISWIGRWSSQTPDLLLPPQGCVVTVEGFRSYLTWEQSGNASIIVGESIRRGLPARAATIALVTAYQESDLRNLDYGDRDSIGLFQQRPSQGWGTVEQIMDPWYSAGKFYEHLVQVPDWETGVINDVAQAVQRSGFPEAYAQHETKGRAWASALTGHSTAAVSCIDRRENPADAAVLSDFIATVWGGAVSVSTNEVDALHVSTDSEITAWSVAQLSMLRGSPAGLTTVQAGAQQWVNSRTDYAVWQPASPAAAPVVMYLRAA